MNTHTEAKPGLLPSDQVMTWEEVRELGLDEAPADIGPCVEEGPELKIGTDLTVKGTYQERQPAFRIGSGSARSPPA